MKFENHEMIIFSKRPQDESKPKKKKTKNLFSLLSHKNNFFLPQDDEVHSKLFFYVRSYWNESIANEKEKKWFEWWKWKQYEILQVCHNSQWTQWMGKVKWFTTVHNVKL